MEEQCILEEEERTPPAWYEVFAFRILNGVMVAVLCKLNLDYILSCSMSTTMLQVMFFLAATVKLQEDDNACLWIPTFLVPAFLSTIVAVICVCLFVFACVCLCLFFVGYLSSPYFFPCYTIYTISLSSHSLSLIYAPICAAKCFYFYQCCLSLIVVLLLLLQCMWCLHIYNSCLVLLQGFDLAEVNSQL